MKLSEAQKIRAAVEAGSQHLNDETAIDVGTLFPHFNPDGHVYTTGDRFFYPANGKLYRVLQGHTSQPDWLPTTAVSLYEEVYVSTGDPCETAPVYDSNNWQNYTVGYQVKHNNAVWEAINGTHTWIAPAHEGDGAISWIHIKDC